MLHISPEGGYRLVTRQFTPDDYNLFRPKQGIELEPANGQTPMPVTEQIITKLDGVEYVAPEEYKSYTDYLADFGKTHCKLAEPPVPEYDLYGYGTPCIGGHDWLSLSTEHIFTGNSSFFDRAFDMFRKPTDDPAQYYKAYAEFGKQTYLAAEELRQQIADGKGDSLFTLKTTFDLGGMKLTVGDLIHLHEGMNQTMGQLKSFGNFDEMAFMGMSVSKFKQYAKETFSPDLTDKLTSFYEDRLQAGLYYSGISHDYQTPGFQPNLNEPYDILPCDYNLSNSRSFNALIYHKFANLDLKDESAYQDAVTWYLQGVQKWCQMASCKYEEGRERASLDHYRSLFLSE